MLKKKYRQMLQEREAGHPEADVDAQRRGTAPWDAPAVSGGRSDTQVNCTSGREDSAATLKYPKVSESTIDSPRRSRGINIYRGIEQHKRALSPGGAAEVAAIRGKGRLLKGQTNV